MEWTDVAQDKNGKRDFVRTIMKLRAPYNTAIASNSWRLIIFWRRTLFRGVALFVCLLAVSWKSSLSTWRYSHEIYSTIAPCSAAQCSAVRCGAVQCSTVQCSAVQCGAVRCSAVQCGAVQCSAVQCSAVQCSVVQCSAVRCSAVPVLIADW